MTYKFKQGTAVVLKDRMYLGEARVAGYRNGTYVLEFAFDHPELADVRYPFIGGREFRGLHAAEHQLQEMVIHDPEKQVYSDPLDAHHGTGNWLMSRFERME